MVSQIVHTCKNLLGMGPCSACDIQVQLASRHLLKAQCKKVYIASHINILHLGFNHDDLAE